MDFFEKVLQAPPDAILGLTGAFARDVRAEKVNLGAGVYRTAELKPFILHSVKKAEGHLLQTEVSKDYLPIEGSPEYTDKIKALVFGGENARKEIFAAQTPGGTAALCVGGNFLVELGLKNLYISAPTWANHNRIFTHAGLTVHSYPYFDRKNKDFDFPAFMHMLENTEKSSVVLLQACCHNPTGMDPTFEQWQEICALIKKREIFPFFDLAYQGFGKGLVEDVEVPKLFLEAGLQFAIALSNSKNFGLYAERCGALLFVCRDEKEAERIGSRLKVMVRGIYSNPPCHGARIVTTILKDPQLSSEWKRELESMRQRITEMRRDLVVGLQARGGEDRFDFLAHQKGMFSYTCLSESHVERLIQEYGIYLPKDGRINVAGLTPQNIDYVIDAIIQVTSSS